MKLTDSPQTYRKLKLYNLVMGFLHLLQGVLMVVVSNDTSAKLTTEFLKFDTQAMQVLQEKEVLFELPLGYSVAVFLFMSALAHFIIGTVYFPKYVENLKKGANYARWIEYAFSSSWMIVIIGILVGMFDAPSLILLFFLNMMMILFGYVMELHNQTTSKTDWTSFIYGCIAGAVPWVVMGWYFYGAVQNTNEVAVVPNFVYGIFISLLVFFNVFAINMILQYKRVGRWKNYLFGEVVYIALSLVAKSLLAWQVWSGTLR
ncbi:MAG TPA: heliorhodopsin HeR [Candidatus Dojkabacteria bacterium]|nr:heliorhodopsin HeR [Candidatus Dojkabacteria bacterium]HRP51167.1 heliorhodopsin HeR [Candidatus Dojkabacteria bacterium]